MTARGTAALASALDLSTPLFLVPMRSDPEVGDWAYWPRGWRPAVCWAPVRRYADGSSNSISRA